MTDLRAALALAVEVAREAGELLRREHHRPGGPRGADGKCPADVEAEARIRARLRDAFEGFGYRAEEEPAFDREPASPAHPTWLVDPNDGTSAFQRGFRGATVSLALVRGDLPVLGVVYAYASPDDDGELFAWAEGTGPATRDGRPLAPLADREALAPTDRVLVSQSADRLPQVNAGLVAPARFVAVPSIAYRLALAAAGDGVAGLSLNHPRDLDYAAGHALLRAVGGELYDEAGRPVRYDARLPTSVRDCFGGVPGLARILAARDFRAIFTSQKDAPERYELSWPVAGETEPDAGRLSRAQGCLFGQLAGDSLGALVEFQTAERIRRTYPHGVRDLVDGGTWDILAGQPTDDSEMALALARSITSRGGYDAEAAAEAYVAWYASSPFDIGNTTRTALAAAASAAPGTRAQAGAVHGSRASLANGSLMRVSPLAVFGVDAPLERLAAWARADARITHPNPICGDATAVFAATLAHAIARGPDPAATHAHALEVASALGADDAVHGAIARAAGGPPADYHDSMGYYAIALQNAFHQLLHAPSLEQGVVDTVGRGGDTDTNAAIAGALLGAVHGRRALPERWRLAVLSCRPVAGVPGVVRPRPRWLWPVDAPILAERLLVLGRAAA